MRVKKKKKKKKKQEKIYKKDVQRCSVRHACLSASLLCFFICACNADAVRCVACMKVVYCI